MKIATYMCDKCNMMHEFSEEDKRDRYLCPDCNSEMWYFRSDEVDDETDLVISTWNDEDKEVKTSHIKNSLLPKPQPKCPTCQSTNIHKMGVIESGASIFTFGLYSKKINKTFKCNNCGYTW